MAIRSISKLSWSVMGILFSSLTAFSQLTVFSFEEMDSLQKTEPRNSIVFIHADWCRFCIEMENTTLKNTDLVTLLNEKFWFISLNAGEKRKIIFSGTVFQYKPNGYETGIHELAEQLGTINNRLSFPGVCILNPEHEIIFQISRFVTAKELLKILNAFIESDKKINK